MALKCSELSTDVGRAAHRNRMVTRGKYGLRFPPRMEVRSLAAVYKEHTLQDLRQSRPRSQPICRLVADIEGTTRRKTEGGRV